jgi:hypothetical protein
VSPINPKSQTKTGSLVVMLALELVVVEDELLDAVEAEDEDEVDLDVN